MLVFQPPSSVSTSKLGLQCQQLEPPGSSAHSPALVCRAALIMRMHDALGDIFTGELRRPAPRLSSQLQSNAQHALVTTRRIDQGAICQRALAQASE